MSSPGEYSSYRIIEIMATYAKPECITDGSPDPVKINPMIMMGTHYWSIGSSVGCVYKTGKI